MKKLDIIKETKKSKQIYAKNPKSMQKPINYNAVMKDKDVHI